MRRRAAMTLALVGGAIVGAVITVAVGGGASAPAVPASPTVTTATVVRTDLATTVLTGGTLGYAPTGPVVNRLAGTYTVLPAVGSVIQADQVLYRVDDQPVVLMTGSTPAWRPLALGVSDGPDVAELQADLIASGDAAGLFSRASGHLDGPTADAIERWQRAEGYAPTGQIALGQVVFLPAAVLVGAESVAPGEVASPGDLPFQVSTTDRTVTVPLNPNLPPVTVGEVVSIVLPSNAATAGKVTAIGPPPPGSPLTGSSSSQSATQSVLTVVPDDPSATGSGSGVVVQVSLTTQAVSRVLAVPVSALLALAGGGYGVEIVGPSGHHRLVGVTTGLFAGSRVQVRGRGITAGVKVVVAQ